MVQIYQTSCVIMLGVSFVRFQTLTVLVTLLLLKPHVSIQTLVHPFAT